MWQGAANNRIGKTPARRDPDAAVVQKGALAMLGGEELVAGGVVDQAGDDLALALQRDRDREVRNSVQEVGGAVEGVDDPGIGLVGALVQAALLAEKAIAGARFQEFGAQNFLGAPVRRGD